MPPKRAKQAPANIRISLPGWPLELCPASEVTVKQDIRRALWLQKMSAAKDEEESLALYGYAHLIAAVIGDAYPSFLEYLELKKSDADKWYDAVFELGYSTNPTSAQPLS